MILIWGKRTADMPKDLRGRPSQCLKMPLHIREQKREIAALMIMCHDSPRDSPEPFNPVGIWIIGRRIDQIEVLFQLGEHAAHKQGPSRRVRLEIVGNHEGEAPATLGAGKGGTHLFAEHISRSSRCHSAVEPAIAPVDQAKAVELAVIPRRLDQPLPAPPFAAPDTRAGRVKGKLDFILQVEVGLRLESEQGWQVGGKLIPQISLDQVSDG